MLLNIFWFRRDLRLEDNAGLFHALKDGLPVVPVFIFDQDILDELEDKNDRRVCFIHNALQRIQHKLLKLNSTLELYYGKPVEIFRKLIPDHQINTVFTNHDYEPYAFSRDEEVKKLLNENNIGFRSFKDQVIFEKDEVVKESGEPYSVFTPYSRKWLSILQDEYLREFDPGPLSKNFFQQKEKPLIGLEQIGFNKMSDVPVIALPDEEIISNYHETRNLPSLSTTGLGVHLRFGTMSIRLVVKMAKELNPKFLNELIWREFFMQILWRNPQLVGQSFKPAYDKIEWRNNEKDFEKWCTGQTGYPIVDAGMRELNATGFMHNRVRMITASFLVKHLLTDWRWGEAYFAKKLVDYELASNNGNWQWVAGCGCDAAPYFRIFNPTVQTKKFDPHLDYTRKWVPELDSFSYPGPMVEHEFARGRCLVVYKKALNS